MHVLCRGRFCHGVLLHRRQHLWRVLFCISPAPRDSKSTVGVFLSVVRAVAGF